MYFSRFMETQYLKMGRHGLLMTTLKMQGVQQML